MKAFNDFIYSIFPKHCPLCEQHIQEEQVICLSCHTQLIDNINLQPHNLDHLNLLHTQFWHPLKFIQNNLVQKAIYEFKYNGNKKIGKYLTQIVLHKTPYTSNPKNILDYIVYIPLTSKKERQRGFNQSLVIAQCLSRALNVPIFHGLKRNIHSASLTNLSRTQRTLQLRNVYEVTDFEMLLGKNILIVDDIITSGATMSVISELLLSKNCGNIYPFSLASKY